MKRVIDFHTHLGKDKDGIELNKEDLIKLMEEFNISESVVFPFNEFNSVEEESMKLKMDIVNEPFYPFFRFDPKKITDEYLREKLNDFYGVKLHPRSQEFDPLNQKYFSLYEIIEEKEKPLLFHTRYESLDGIKGTVNPNSNPDRIIQLAKYFPKLNLVLGHFANFSSYVIQEMKNHKNVYLETSILGSTPRAIESVSKEIGSDRIIFGSDAPFSNPGIERLNIDYSNIKQIDKEKIFFYNAEKLLKL